MLLHRPTFRTMLLVERSVPEQSGIGEDVFIPKPYLILLTECVVVCM